MGIFRKLTRGDVETTELQPRGLHVNLIADSLNLKFLLYFVDMSSYFSMKTNKIEVTESKRKMEKKHSLKDCIKYFLSFLYKNITYYKIKLFHAVLLVQKYTIRAGYAERTIK